jgi:hypothetical protein
MNSEGRFPFLGAASQKTKTISSPLSHDRHTDYPVVSRRRFIGGAATAVGTVLGASVLRPGAALAKPKPQNATPNPIPGGTTVGGQLFHFFPFGPGQEPATITDFNGFVGVADVQGTGTATNPDGSTETLLFDTDIRFMKGVYVGKDGAIHKATFGFI